MPTPHPPASPSSSPRRRRWLVWTAVTALVALIAAELIARFALGLGDPPLYVLDPKIEYQLAPTQDCQRFGNAFRTNRFGMRSDDFPEKKPSPDELRVLVIGDSIINGGARVDQADLATSVLKRELSARLHRPITVGNVSAGSWGPVNQLAYLQKYGLFDADVVVLVLNTEDAADVPGLELIGPQWPRRKPLLALQELGERYLPGIFLPLGGNAPPSPPPSPHTTSRDEDIARTREAVREIVRLAAAGGARTIVVRYSTRDELARIGDDPTPEFMRPPGVVPAQTAAAFRASMDSEFPFQRDGVHPSAVGQRVLGDLLADLVVDALRPENPAPPGAEPRP